MKKKSTKKSRIKYLESAIRRLESKEAKSIDDKDKLIRYKRELLKLNGTPVSIETNNWTKNFTVYGAHNKNAVKL